MGELKKLGFNLRKELNMSTIRINTAKGIS